MKISVLPILAITLATIALVGIAATNQAPIDDPSLSWGTHEPFKDCVACHGEQAGDSQNEPIAPAPQLCYRCHKEYAELDGWKHGPVAMGQCLLCHKPHKIAK